MTVTSKRQWQCVSLPCLCAVFSAEQEYVYIIDVLFYGAMLWFITILLWSDLMHQGGCMYLKKKSGLYVVWETAVVKLGYRICYKSAW